MSAHIKTHESFALSSNRERQRARENERERERESESERAIERERARARASALTAKRTSLSPFPKGRREREKGRERERARERERRSHQNTPVFRPFQRGKAFPFFFPVQIEARAIADASHFRGFLTLKSSTTAEENVQGEEQHDSICTETSRFYLVGHPSQEGAVATPPGGRKGIN